MKPKEYEELLRHYGRLQRKQAQQIKALAMCCREYLRELELCFYSELYVQLEQELFLLAEHIQTEGCRLEEDADILEK